MIAAALALAWLAPSQAPAQAPVTIRPQHRVGNLPPGCCGYATAETVALHAGHPQARGMTQVRAAMPCPAGSCVRHPCVSTQAEVSAELSGRGIPHTQTAPGDRGLAPVRRSLASGVPAVVWLAGDASTGGVGHVVAVAGVSPSAVQVYDPNTPSRPWGDMPASEFRSRWRGGAILIQRKH